MSTRRYIVAENEFTVSWDDDLTPWQLAMPHFQPFSADGKYPCRSVLDIRLRYGHRPEFEGVPVYEDVSDDKRRRMRVLYGKSQGFLVEFYSDVSRRPDCWMEISPGLDRAEIVMAAESEHRVSAAAMKSAMLLAYVVATIGNGTLVVHASAIVCDGRAWLFQGKSGTGKSTHSRLWTGHVAGAALLNDDHPVVRVRQDGGIMAYGSPWSGKTHCYRHASAPLGAMVRIRRSLANSMRRLPKLEAFASLTASMLDAPFHARLCLCRHAAIESIIAAVPCYELRCLPEPASAMLCQSALLQSL